MQMTVRELIEELQRQPNLDLPVQAVGICGDNYIYEFEYLRGVTPEGPYVALKLGHGESRNVRLSRQWSRADHHARAAGD